jgi:RHS repeat-associated protein
MLYHRQQQNLFTGVLQAQTRVFYFAGRPVAQLDGPPATGTLMYLSVDHLGTPILASTSAGISTWSGGFEPFGKDFTTPTAQQSKVFLRLPGQWDDAVWDSSGLGSGLYYNLNRWYEPASSRYLVPDPVDQGRRVSVYAYALSRPTRLKDPLGLFTIDPSCDDLRCKQTDVGNVGNRYNQVKLEVEAACMGLDFTIYNDSSLLQCLQRKCETGRINCSWKGDPRTDPCNINKDAGAWGPIGSGEAHLCPDNWVGAGPGDLGNLVIHEWSHNCGWRHGQGHGVPADPGPDPAIR